MSTWRAAAAAFHTLLSRIGTHGKPTKQQLCGERCQRCWNEVVPNLSTASLLGRILLPLLRAPWAPSPALQGNPPALSHRSSLLRGSLCPPPSCGWGCQAAEWVERKSDGKSRCDTTIDTSSSGMPNIDHTRVSHIVVSLTPSLSSYLHLIFLSNDNNPVFEVLECWSPLSSSYYQSLHKHTPIMISAMYSRNAQALLVCRSHSLFLPFLGCSTFSFGSPTSSGQTHCKKPSENSSLFFIQKLCTIYDKQSLPKMKHSLKLLKLLKSF